MRLENEPKALAKRSVRPPLHHSNCLTKICSVEMASASEVAMQYNCPSAGEGVHNPPVSYRSASVGARRPNAVCDHPGTNLPITACADRK